MDYRTIEATILMYMYCVFGKWLFLLLIVFSPWKMCGLFRVLLFLRLLLWISVFDYIASIRRYIFVRSNAYSNFHEFIQLFVCVCVDVSMSLSSFFYLSRIRWTWETWKVNSSKNSPIFVLNKMSVLLRESFPTRTI